MNPYLRHNNILHDVLAVPRQSHALRQSILPDFIKSGIAD